MIYNVEVLVIGGGTAGTHAAVAAASAGAKVLLVDRNSDIREEIHNDSSIEVWSPATAVGFYEDNVVTVVYQGKHIKVKPQRLIAATGSMEKFLAFGNNDLPGVISAKTAGIMLDKYGVLPAERVLIADSDNNGGCIAEKLASLNVDVRTIAAEDLIEAIGEDEVTGALIRKNDDSTETASCGAILVAAGSVPLVDLITLTECKMNYVEELSGYVPETDVNMETSRRGVYCAGDAAGVESDEASALEGTIAGYSAAISLGFDKVRMIGYRKKAQDELEALRDCPAGAQIRAGREQFSI